MAEIADLSPFVNVKHVLGVSRKSCDDAVRGELSRYPILLMSVQRWINYAKHCYSLPVDNFARASSTPMMDDSHLQQNFMWVELQSNALFHPALPAYVKNHFTSKYVQAWLMAINKNYEPSHQNKLRIYASFRTTFGMGNYVLSLKLPDRRQFTKLRISSHHLAIETGRFQHIL